MSIPYRFLANRRAGEPRSRHGVIISGYFGYENSGDDASLDCIAAAVKRAIPNIRISALCKGPAKFSEAHGVCGIGRFDPLAVLRELRYARLLISGGGSLMQNATSTRSLVYYTGIILLARLCGVKIYICANGIGPVKGSLAKKLIKAAVSAADIISVRDRQSQEALTCLGIPTERITITPDTVFQSALYPPHLSHAREYRPPLGLRGRYFAVSVRRSGLPPDRLSELYRGLRAIMLRFDMTPVFIPMQNYEDSAPTRLAAEGTGGEAVISPYLSRSEICALLRGAELAVSMRLHLMIYAAISGTPAVGIAVDPKIGAISEQLGLGAPIESAHISAGAVLEAAEGALKCDRAAIWQAARQLAERSADETDAALRALLDPPQSG